MTRPIVSRKTLPAKAEGRLPKNFGVGRLCSALVILWWKCCFVCDLGFWLSCAVSRLRFFFYFAMSVPKLYILSTIRRVLLGCHKNKRSFCFSEGGQEKFLLVKNIFWTNQYIKQGTFFCFAPAPLNDLLVT